MENCFSFTSLSDRANSFSEVSQFQRSYARSYTHIDQLKGIFYFK